VPGEDTRVNLGGLGSLESMPLAALMASLRGLRRRRICNPLDNFTPPTGQGPDCLGRDALKALIDEGKGHWQESDVVLGCEAFANSDGIDRVAASLQKQLLHHTDWSSRSLSSFGTLVLELAENVMQHSAAHGGVTVLEIDSLRQQVSLAMADSGIGIRRSLASNPDYEDIDDDLTAIRTSMLAKTSGEPGTGGGMGLYLARLMVRDNGGSFLIRSGTACRDESETIRDSKELPHLHGTLISVQARTDRALDYSQVEETLNHLQSIIS